MRRQLRLPGFQQKQPKGGGVETSRGKKGKKTGWHLKLGLKDTIFAGIGVVGLMMMSFALGALAGRGDIYRAAYTWGLLRPDGPRVAQWTPLPPVPAVPPPAAPGSATAPAPAGAPASPAPAAVAAKPGAHAPVAGSITPLPSLTAHTATKKKGKIGTTHRDRKSRQEELRRVRQEMVKKLKFQNSFDTGPKPQLSKAKDHNKLQSKSNPTQVRVAQYRSSKQAQAKVAELQKKGIKATLKKTKDSKGTLYTIYKITSPTHSGTEKLARKPVKSGGPARKPKAD